MYNMRLSSKVLLSGLGAGVSELRTIVGMSLVRFTIGITSLFATAISEEVAKTKATFFASEAVDTCKHNTLSGYNFSRLPGLDPFWPNSYYGSYYLDWWY